MGPSRTASTCGNNTLKGCRALSASPAATVHYLTCSTPASLRRRALRLLHCGLEAPHLLHHPHPQHHARGISGLQLVGPHFLSDFVSLSCPLLPMRAKQWALFDAMGCQGKSVGRGAHVLRVGCSGMGAQADAVHTQQLHHAFVSATQHAVPARCAADASWRGCALLQRSCHVLSICSPHRPPRTPMKLTTPSILNNHTTPLSN